MIGVVWALGLWLAAPALRAGSKAAAYGVADRLRDAIFIGIALPLVFGAFDLLWPLPLAIALLILIAFARRNSPAAATPQTLPVVTLATLAFLAWPALTRPPLEGDTLWYHLPNAASWVHAHGIWITNTRYWWYPPASELFASGLYAFGAGSAVGLSGLAALSLLGMRIVTWARERCACPPLLADLLGAAAVASLPIALQAGTLQNDVWQAAFVVELLWCANVTEARNAGMLAAAVCVLIKPNGWLFALIALLSTRARLPYWVAAGAAGAFLIARAVLMDPRALVPIAATSHAVELSTSIVAHGAGAIGLALGLLSRAAPLAGAALIAAVLGPVLGRQDRALGYTALGSAVVFLLIPWGFADAHPQLATGASLRYADPAIACGILLIAPFLRRYERGASIALALCIVYGCVQIAALFWNDETTRAALVVALLCGAAALASARTRFALPSVATACALFAAWHAGGHAADYYADALAVSGKTSGIYTWIAQTRPERVAVLGFPAGTVAVLSPSSWFVDTFDGRACAAAQAVDATLIASSEPARRPPDNAARRRDTLACAPVIYRDDLAVAVRNR